VKKKAAALLAALLMASVLSACSFRTVEEMYRLPRRSEGDDHLQQVIDQAMDDLVYSAPVAGENQQTVQTADLNGDGQVEYIVFARDNVNKALRILVFGSEEDTVKLLSVMESYGSAFEQVEYVNMDDHPGMEMVVGRRVSDQVLRSVSVYSFAGGTPEQLITSSCRKFLTCDLDQNGRTELMLIQPGETDADRGHAVLHRFIDGVMERTHEAELSASADSVKRIMISRLEGGSPAVYVASALDENAVITDVFAMRDGIFSNISFSNESGTSVQTLRNYYVYADDIDSDGVLEMPDLITMQPIKNSTNAQQQYLIRWYSMDLAGNETSKCYTFHNYVGGWYLKLQEPWAERISVIQTEGTYWFYVWDADFAHAELVFSVHALTGTDREEEAVQNNRFVLLRTEGVIYAARLESGAADYLITQEDLTPCFYLIHQAWKTGET